MQTYDLRAEIDSLNNVIEQNKEDFRVSIEQKDQEFAQYRENSENEMEDMKMVMSNAIQEANEAKAAGVQNKNRAGELHHALVQMQEHNEKIEELYNALQISGKTNEYRVKELQAMVDTIMRYPDASLGQMMEEPSSDDRYDEVFKEMINSNNLRISLLEQKNNEFRCVRLKFADGDHSKLGEFVSKKSVPVQSLFSQEQLDRRPSSAKLSHHSRVASRNPSTIDAIIPLVKREKSVVIQADEADFVSSMDNRNQRPSEVVDRSMKNPMPLLKAAEILLSSSPPNMGGDARAKSAAAKKYLHHEYRHHEKLPGNESAHPPSSKHFIDSAIVKIAVQQKCVSLEPTKTAKTQFLKNPDVTKRLVSYSSQLTNFQELRNPKDPAPKRQNSVSPNKTHFPIDEHRGFAANDNPSGGSTEPRYEDDDGYKSGSSMLNLLKGITQEERALIEKRARQNLVNEGYYGGWWPEPKSAKFNSVITMTAILGLTGAAWTLSADRERRLMYPQNWIPSMLWAKEFHDPKHVAFWKEQLEKEGREWIEPIPDSMKSWWPLYRKQE
ncbi:hypothetical protein HDU98_010173 [Podochytrium sp. JEL0797]|nr:hypothetical protein HDU98_010173 [Podochytrium sp. JEL0797]